MCPMLLSRLTDGPSFVLSPAQDHVFFPFPSYPRLDSPSTSSSSSFVDLGGNNSNSFANGISTSSASKKGVTFPAPVTANPSKKRSCREAGFDCVGVVDAASSGPMAASARFLNQPTAHSHMGSWHKVANSESNSNTVRKSQRLDTSAPEFGDGFSYGSSRRILDGHSGKRSGSLSSQEPSVDDATRLLGISWQRIDNDDDFAAAMRGWKKYIDIEYSTYLQDSQILLKNRASNLYLVAAHPKIPVASASASPSLSFYLFSEDLTQAQLVGSTWEITVQNLRSVPILFEGTEVLRAGVGAADKSPYQQRQDNGNVGNMIAQTSFLQPASCGGSVESNGGMGMGTGMEIDS